MASKSPFFLISLLVTLVFLIGCDEGTGPSEPAASGETAAVSFMLQWPEDRGRQKSAPDQPTICAVKVSDDCAARGITHVEVSIRDSSDETIETGTFDCSAGQGTLEGVAPQSDCTIVVSGLNSGGNAVYEGRNTDVDLYAGPNNVGVIQMEALITPGPPGDLSNSLGMTFVYIEPGTFTMGSPSDEPGRNNDETQHEVTLTQGYYMQTTEVTQGQWEAVMGSNPSYFEECGDDCPVEGVSWYDARNFIDELNSMEEGTYRLATEAEWEYAARAGSTTAFANGGISETGSGYDPVLDSMGWYAYNSEERTHPVARKDPNSWGLYDMHGNVREWVADRYGPYPSSSVVDPTGPELSDRVVNRGGSYMSYAHFCRSAWRWGSKRDYNSFSGIGFRIVRTPDQ